MLAGLEDRQAYMSEGRDIILDGLTSVNDDTFHKSRRRSPAYLKVLIPVVLGISISAYVYKQYPGYEIHVPTADIVYTPAQEQDSKAADNSRLTGNVGETVTKNDQLPQQPSPVMPSIALKMDYSITGADTAKPVPVQQAVVVTEKEQVEPNKAAVIKPSILAFAVSSNDGSGSVVDVKLNEKSDYRVYELNKPFRVAVEFDKYLTLPDVIPEVFEYGLVSKIRGHHIHNNKRTMIVLDLTEKGKIKNSELKAIDGGYELIVSISPANNVIANNNADSGNDTPVPEMPSTEETVKTNEGKLSVTKNNSTPEQLLARGVNDYQKGRKRDGLEQISKALEIDPAHVQARSTLVNLLIEQKNIPLAINILDQGLALLPQQFDWRELKAKLLVKLNKNSEAIEALIHAGPDINSNPDYYAFLAALLQEQGRNAEAVNYYQKILNIRGDNGVWWLGLGISQERTGNSVQAKNAYQNAVRDEALSPDIREYIKNRLLILSQQ